MSAESENPNPPPSSSFRPDLSDVWQDEVLRAVGSVAEELRQFTFVTHANSDTLTVRFVPSEEVAALIQARLSDDQEFADEGHIEFRYWRRYDDLLDEIDQEMPADMKFRDLLRRKKMAFQLDWPVLDIAHGGFSQGPFLNRVTKKQLRSRVRRAILQEMFEHGYICRAQGENGPFQTLDGENI